MGCPSWTSATIRLVARCASARKLPSARTASSISTVKPALAGAFTARDFLILTSFLQSRYAQDKPLALSARITFEQSYGEVEGDSASSTEVYALLSALSGIP